MDLNKVCIYTVALPKPLSQVAKWGKGRCSHELDGYNGATCWRVLAMISNSTVWTWYNVGEGMNEWHHINLFIYSEKTSEDESGATSWLLGTVRVFFCRSPLSIQEQYPHYISVSVPEGKLRTADVSKIYTSISVQLATNLITTLMKWYVF